MGTLTLLISFPDELYYGGFQARVPNFVKSKGSKEEAASGRDPRELRADPRLPVDPRDMRGYLPPHHPMQPHATLQPQPGMWPQRGVYDHGMGESPPARPAHRRTHGREVTGRPDQHVTRWPVTCPAHRAHGGH